MAFASVDDVTDQLAQTRVSRKFELSFKGKGLKLDKAEDAKEIVSEIEKCQVMTSLRLEGNTMGVAAAEVIAKAIEKHPEFERALWSDMFTGRLKSEIPNALRHLGNSIMSAGCKLIELDLSDNAFGPNGVVGLVDLLKSSACFSLKELRLNNNGLGIGGGKMLAESLLECHKASQAAGTPLALKVFISGRNRLENDGATALAKAFTTIGTLEFLAMPQNGINHPGISALAKAVAANPRLRHLNLNDNTFTARGAEEIATSLPYLTQLEVLNFGDCLVRTEGASSLAQALSRGHTALKEVILSGNEISTSGAIELAEALEGKDKLIKFDLNANNLGETGCETVRDTLAALGLGETLQSLSDDEGTDEEDDDDDDDDDDYEDDEEYDEEEEDENGESTVVQNSTYISMADFLTAPSASKLLQLEQNCGNALKLELGADGNDVEKAVNLLFKVLTVVSKDDEAKLRACQCADTVLQHVLKTADQTGYAVVNAILVAMGLIKDEDRRRRVCPGGLVGPLLVLEHVVRQSYCPPPARQCLLTFLSKPNDNLDKAGAARHKILQTLYAF